MLVKVIKSPFQPQVYDFFFFFSVTVDFKKGIYFSLPSLILTMHGHCACLSVITMLLNPMGIFQLPGNKLPYLTSPVLS